MTLHLAHKDEMPARFAHRLDWFVLQNYRPIASFDTEKKATAYMMAKRMATKRQEAK